MKLTLDLYTTRLAEFVRLGMVVDTPDGPITVDEVRHRRDSDTGGDEVHLLGRRVRSDATRRVVHRTGPKSYVRVLPEARHVDAVWESVRDAVATAVQHYMEEQAAETAGDLAAAPWSVESGVELAIVIDAAGGPWRLAWPAAEPQDDPPGPDDDQAEADSTAEPE